MARDAVKSVATIPNPTDNFDEVWMAVRRENGLFVERMVLRLKESSCGDDRVLLDEQVFMDSTVSYDDGQIVTAITATNGVIYTITSENHGYSNGDTVVMRNVYSYPALNNTKWTISVVDDDTFILYSRVN